LTPRRASYSSPQKAAILDSLRAHGGNMGVAPIIAYGDASFRASGRGRQSAPTTAMHHACVAVMGARAVVFTSEFRSSKCCCCCGVELQEVKRMGVQRRLVERAAAKQREADAGKCAPPRPLPRTHDVRGLRRCDNKLCARASTTFIDRDFHAAVNILRAFRAADAGRLPPLHMRRTPAVGDRDRRAPGLFILAATAPTPAGARDSGWTTHERRAAARATQCTHCAMR
jgi:hypothetical protein